MANYTANAYASYFGASAAVERMTIAESVETIKYQNGLNEAEWPLRRMETLTKEYVEYADWGTCPDTDETNNTFGCVIDSLTWTKTERMGTPKEQGSADFNACPGSIPDPDDMKLLILTSGIIWLGVEHTLSLTGKFKGVGGADTLLRELMTEGGRITKPLKLTGAGLTTDVLLDYTPTADNPFTQPFVRSVTYECTRDWTTFSAELSWFVPQAAADLTSSPMSDSEDYQLIVFSSVPALSSYYKCSQTITLSSQDNPRVSESIEFYEDGTSGANGDVPISGLAGTTNFP